MANQIEDHETNLVFGRVVDKLNNPLANLIVHVFDRDMRSEEILGESLTDREGKYEITWLQNQLNERERKTADISLKVFTSKNMTLLYESDMDAVRFNASPREEINITIERAIKPEVVEYDFILKEVSFLAGNVAIIDLQENKEHRDITFLSKEAEIPAEKIEHLVVAHRLQDRSEIDAAFFYALLRKNTLLKNDFVKSFHARLVIDINTEIIPLLYDAALTDVKTIQRDTASAVKEMIVPARVSREWQVNAEQLQQYRQQAEDYYKNEHPRKVLDLISRFVLENKLEEMEQIFQQYKNDLDGFFQKIADESFFKSDEKAADAKTALALGQLLGFDEIIISRVKESQKIKKPGDVKKLAALNKAGWKEVLMKSTDKIDIAGKPLDKKLVDLYASSLVRKMEKEFPTAAFAAQLGREKKSLYENQEAITDFFAKYESFDLIHSSIDLFFKEKKLAGDKNAAMREELKTLQRVFKLVPHYGKTNALLKQNIHSAQSIAALGETRFLKEIAPKAGIETKEAKEIFNRAERTNTAAMLIVGELQDTMRAVDIPALETSSLTKKLEAVSKDFPNLKSLFKITDTCTCEHCRSVYSPAAYLVEILEFLDKRSVTDLTVTPHVTAKLAKDVLFERRPDLGEIDLGCENANTPVPYIDLVCELLEEAVAPDTGINYTGNLSDGTKTLKGKISNSLLTALAAANIPVTGQAQIFETETSTGSSATLPHYLRDKKAVCKIVNTGGNNYKVFRLRQTLSSAEELAAAPEYVNREAYKVLKKSNYAFKLPFDLDHTEAKAYFSRFNISRAKLMEDFQLAGKPADQAIAADILGLTDAERNLIATPGTANQQKYWNTTNANASKDMKVVDTFLTKSGLTYKELDLLLTLKFIDPANNLFIKHLDLTCDTEKKEIANLDDAALDRIHRFLRLQKKTGWKFEVIDAIISQAKLGKKSLDNACLIKAANLDKLTKETSIKIEELIGFYGEIPHKILKEDAPKPLYHQVFLNKARNGFIDQDLLPEKVDGSKLLSTFKTSISVCLQIKEQDLDKLLPLLPDGKLTFSNLSYLFAGSKLMKKLNLKAEEFVSFVQLTGINIQNSPQVTLDFIEAVKSAQKSPLKIADVQFMLSHKATNLPGREIKDNKITQILKKLQKDYQSNFAAKKSPFDANLSADEQKATLQTALSKLSGIEEEDVKTFIKFIDKGWTSKSMAKTFTDAKLKSLFDTTSIKKGIDDLEAATVSDYSSKQKNLVEVFLDTIADYVLKIGKLSILEQILTKTFKADSELVKIVLKYAILKKPAPGTALLSDILLSDTLIDVNIKNTTPVLPAITKAKFLQHYGTIKLLHKLFPLINAFKLSNRYIAWFFKNNQDLGWFEWDSIPYKAGQKAIDYAKYSAFTEMINLSKQLTPVLNPADAENPITFLTIAEMLLSAGGAAQPQFLETLSVLTGYNKEDVEAIDAYLFPPINLSRYRDVKTWKSMIACAEHLRNLGSTVPRVKKYIEPELTSTGVSLLRTALKARYDEDTWLKTLKEIMDAVRPQKRDALVAYLLAANPEIKDENYLYDYFLVDVEMEACMPSSRIVQAHGTIQLFVQRCLMGLEPKAAADVNNDKYWNQWKWMKNYRVWEANRKVFLYPENWIEPELRDDRSFLFKELENEIQQNELTKLTAEQALIKYLEKLDNIAFLEVMTAWYQSDIKTMHVFARTKSGDPAIYYYRKFEKEQYWTPWEKVELDIPGDHLLAFVRNNRLCLAWPVFTEEPDSDQTSKVPKTTEQGKEIKVDKPKRKLKIQLAISEFANKKWQPKKISKDGILTPQKVTSDDYFFKRNRYNLMYFELAQQVWIFNSYSVVSTAVSKDTCEYHELNGIFNIAGCKGYPELVPDFKEIKLPDFLPDFKNTALTSQRYNEVLQTPPDFLQVKNGISFFNFYEILGKTPGTPFKLTYPHQFTMIDVIVLLFQFLLKSVNGEIFPRVQFFTPLGTLLPYFKEDSNHAYVIIPGFYKNVKARTNQDLTVVSRTVSDVMKLIEDIASLYKKYIAKYAVNPDINALLQLLAADNEYQQIIAELKVYGGLKYGEQFKNMYHPLICLLRKTLYKHGIPELMKRKTQLQVTNFNFKQYYAPNTAIVPKTYIFNKAGVEQFSYPVEDLDFSSDGSYSGYNWELFFHVPLLLATRLTKNQRFEEALTWFHYMFNPTGALAGTTPQKFWVTKPFYLTQDKDYVNQRIDTLLYKIADPNTTARKELESAIAQWRNKPFKPHVIARSRTAAYQKALLMKYIDNLTEWGDYLFRQDTMESIAQATQMYILADKLLGPKPRIIPPPIKAPYETYNQMKAKLGAFGNALIDLENIIPDLSALPEGGSELPPPPVTLSVLYFCIPQNDKMLEYWDRIADRLFKIRHCQNIDGVERTLALFAPPIDPGMLVRAAAAGLDISSVLAGINAPTPYYRFNLLSQKATELAQEVRGLGSSLLQALEKKDAEAMSLLRSKLEIKVLNAVKDMKLLQIKEAKEQIEILNKTRAVIKERYLYYSRIKFITELEQASLDHLEEAFDNQDTAKDYYEAASILGFLPSATIGQSGFGGTPQVTFQWGTQNIISGLQALASFENTKSSMDSNEANRVSTRAGYARRWDEWKLQERVAKKELAQIDKQKVAAKIRKEIAEKDLKNHELQIENAKKIDEFMRSKFTNKELYEWMVRQISLVYFRAYQLAHDFAKKAERSYRFELGNDDSFIQYGYWDSMKKGLQSADHLIHDIKRMETSYLDKNKREYELTKHVSLALLDPLALIKLRATGACDFDIPEVLFDMDHAGQYFRRIKSVSISMPCIAGPYTSASAKLSLVTNKYRKNTNPTSASTSASKGYKEDLGNDDRFIYNIGAIQSIATSSSQNDSGIFELNFRDERYLPFEGTGAISSWRLELPEEVRQFDYNTISDVILHIKYTAREGGSTLKGAAETTLKARLAEIKQELKETGLHLAINMKHDRPNEWNLLWKNKTIDMKIDKSGLPYMAQTTAAAIDKVIFIAKVKPKTFSIKVDGNPVILSRIDKWKLCQLCQGNSKDIDLDKSFKLSVPSAQLDYLEELMLVVKYSF